MSKDIMYGHEARLEIKKGVDRLANAVKVTLGPKGRNVLIEADFGGSRVTKDGVTVARNIKFRDPLQKIGAEIVKDVAFRTVENAGDGTTTACLLAQHIYGEGLKHISNGADPMQLRYGIEIGADMVVEELRKAAKPIVHDQIENIARISANGDARIGKLVGDAIKQIGEYGFVSVEDSRAEETRVEITMGMEFKRGLVSPYFANTNDGTCEYQDCIIMLYDSRIDNVNEMINIVNHVTDTFQKPVMIIAEDFSDAVVHTFLLNISEGRIRAVLVRAPGFEERIGDYLDDIGILTGAKPVMKRLGHKLSDVKSIVFGESEKVIVAKHSTKIIGGKGDKIQIDNKVNELKIAMNAPDIIPFEKDKLETRIAMLNGGVAIIKAGGKSFVEMQEVKDRIDDSLHATKAAIEEGVVPGGGIALAKVARRLRSVPVNGFKYNIIPTQDIFLGVNAVLKACEYPVRQIALNAGKSDEKIYEEVIAQAEDFEIGYDAYSDKWGNMYELGILDPVKVTRVAIEHAASVSALLLTTEAVVMDDNTLRKYKEEREKGE